MLPALIRLGPFCVVFKVLAVPPQSRNMHARLTGDSTVSVGEGACVAVCLIWTCSGLGVLSYPTTAGICSSAPVTLKWVYKMDRWMDDLSFSVTL